MAIKVRRIRNLAFLRVFLYHPPCRFIKMYFLRFRNITNQGVEGVTCDCSLIGDDF